MNLWGWNPSLQLEVENIKMLSQLLQVQRLIQTQFQDKHVCTQHTQGNKWFSDTTVIWGFSSTSRDINLEKSLFTVTSLASKLTTGSLPPSHPKAYQSHSKGMSLLHPEIKARNSLNIDQTLDFSIL